MTIRSDRPAPRPPGFALLIVLWSLVLIGLLMTQILAAGRTAVQLAGNARDAAALRADADGAINEALYHLLAAGPDHWAADGAPHRLGGGLIVRIRTFADKINPNLASTGLLAGLLQAVGAAPQQAAELAMSIIQWRSPAATPQAAAAQLAAYRRAGLAYGPPGRPFTDPGDLGDVIGMTPLLLARTLPYLSVYQSDDPDRASAGPVVRAALNLSGQAGASATGYDGTTPTVLIDVLTPADGDSSRRVAIVSLAAAGAPVPFRFLSLTDGP